MHTNKQLSSEILFEILENIYNEIYVLDKNMNVIYVNEACCKHYGLFPEEMIGHNHMEFVGEKWYPTVIPQVYETKRTMHVEQITCVGQRIIATANPVLDENGEIEMIICVTEELVQHFDIQYPSNDTSLILSDDEKSSSKSLANEKNSDIVVGGDVMINVLNSADLCASCDVTVLLQGESGTGKSILAEHIHQSSNRREKPFIEVNCAALPENLLELELFGCVPHAFTGAPPQGSKGILEEADGGTLFLDEIGEIPMPLQAKLLHVLENKTFTPLGGKTEKHVDIRVITATNRDLNEMIHAGLFREDLYWRLNVMNINIPPLRERGNETLNLIHHFQNKFNEKYNSNKKLSPEAEKMLLFYHWPGNIRQVKNMIEGLTVTTENDIISLEDLPIEVTSSEDTIAQTLSLEDFRKMCAQKILKDAYDPEITTRQLADKLGVSQSTVVRLMKKYLD